MKLALTRSKKPVAPPPPLLDKEQARNAVGATSLALGALAVLAPSSTARAFGVKGPGGALPLLVRMVGVRNAALGVRTMQSQGGEQKRSVQAGLVLGVVDTAAMLLAARSGAVSKRAAAGGLLVLGAFAAAGVVAASD